MTSTQAVNISHTVYSDYATPKLIVDRVMADEEDGWLYKVTETGQDSGRWTIDVYDSDDKYVGTF